MTHPFRQVCGLLAFTTLAAAAADVLDDPSAKPASPTPGRAAHFEGPMRDLGLLHSDKESSGLNEFWFLGRYHVHYHWSEGTNGNEDAYETRRNRIGFQARMFKQLTVHAQMVSGPDLKPYYNGFTELWVSWAFDDALTLTLGQQKHRFTHDRNVSSRYLNYLERSMLVNMFALDYTPAVTLSGRMGKFNYYTGLFSNDTSRDMDRAFTDLNSGWSYIAAGTWDLGKNLGTDASWLTLSYLHSEATRNATLMNRFQHGVSAAVVLADGPFSLVTEATAGLSGQRGHAYGVNLQPGWFITDKLQLVGRYQLAGSDQSNGLRAQRRYERTVGMNTGDLYQATYLGLNYYIFGHRAKILAGAEYATLGGRESWMLATGFRIFWGPHSRAPFPAVDPLGGSF